MLKQAYAVMCQTGEGHDYATRLVRVYQFEVAADVDCRDMEKNAPADVRYYVIPVTFQENTSEERKQLVWERGY